MCDRRTYQLNDDALRVSRGLAPPIQKGLQDGKAWREQSMVYRMPLDGSAPSALNVSGSPVDQFSFLESEDGNLNVLVRSDASGDGMWGAEGAAGDIALMRVPLTSFSDGSSTVSPFNYHSLPKPEGYTFQNRFVGDYLLYGTGSGWGRPEKDRHCKQCANNQQPAGTLHVQ